jgi:hypothetical protein
VFQSKAKGEIVFFCGYRCANMLLFFLLTFTTCFSCNTLDKERKCTKILKRFDVIQLNFPESNVYRVQRWYIYFTENRILHDRKI